MKYFYELDFFESLEVYNYLQKDLGNQLTKEFIIEIIKAMFGGSKKSKEVNRTDIDDDIDSYF